MTLKNLHCNLCKTERPSLGVDDYVKWWFTLLPFVIPIIPAFDPIYEGKLV